MEKIKILRDEAIRLIALQKDLLKTIKEKIPAHQHQDTADTDGKQPTENEQFTPKAIDKKIASLEENRIKLQELDMVLAVVGTMKAGKSTCINAIVGREILPNRNRPMTALPTLIRHVAGAEQPVLHFKAKQQEPIQHLVKQLRNALNQDTHKNTAKIDADKDLKTLAESISNHFELRESYAGEEGIFEFLKSLNDLVRLSKELGIAFPFEHYTSIEDFPLIEVEFFHLKQTGKNNTLGRFTLLDTPGFNEAGQSDHLLPMLQEQLSKATAVLAVLDYTQLKSESEEDLRKELESIAKYSKGRMFALVNKFDMKNSNSDDETETRKYVSQNLLPDIVPEEKVFPVAGRLAYLAKRAELELAKNETLTLVKGQKENWVDDFGKEAFGTRYEKNINDRTKVIEAYEDLWKESLFDKPLNDVIQYSYKNAAQMAIQAATDKLNAYAQGNKNTATPDGIGAMLALRLRGFDVDAKLLSELVEDLNEKLKKLRKQQDKATLELANLVAGVSIEVGKKIKQVDTQAKKSIQQFMEKGGNLSVISIEYQEMLNNTLKSFDFYKNRNPWGFMGFQFESEDDRLNNTTKELLKRFPSEDKDARALLKKLEKMPRTASKEHIYAIFPASKSEPQKDINLKDEMAYESAAEASTALREIDDIVSKFLNENTDAITNYLDETSEEFERNLSTLRNTVEEQVTAFKEHASTAGFNDLKFNVPKIKRIKLGQDSANVLSGLIQDKSYTKPRKREQSGGWGWFKRKVDIFEQGWGQDDYDAKISKFTFLKSDLQAHYDEHIQQYSQQLKESVASSFTIRLESSKDIFFESMHNAFFSIRESMEASLRDQKKSVEEKIQAKQDIQELHQTYSDNVDEINSLVRNSKNLTSISAPSPEAAYA